MHFPGRKELAGNDPYRNVARGQQVTADTTRAGVVDDGNIAWPERIEQARRSWPEARTTDFEQTGRRRSVDRATGREYRRVPGAPLLAVGSESTRGISTWFVAGNALVFLEPDDYPRELHGATGAVHSQVVSPASPGPSGPRIL